LRLSPLPLHNRNTVSCHDDSPYEHC
jgi:hypothetical protein